MFLNPLYIIHHLNVKFLIYVTYTIIYIKNLIVFYWNGNYKKKKKSYNQLLRESLTIQKWMNSQHLTELCKAERQRLLESLGLSMWKWYI